MRHGIKGRKLNRKTSHRQSLLRNLAASLVTHEQVRTTVAKAKELRPYADKLITLGKQGDLHARRQIINMIGQGNKELAEKLCTTLSDRYKDRNGGYTRIMRNGFRFGDSSPMAVIEFVDRDVQAKGKADLERVAQEEAELEAQEAV